MEVIIRDTYDEISKAAADIVAQTMNSKPNSVLGLATGSTPLGLYQELVRLHREASLDFSQVTTFNLDEYVGLGRNDPQSYTISCTRISSAISISRRKISTSLQERPTTTKRFVAGTNRESSNAAESICRFWYRFRWPHRV